MKLQPTDSGRKVTCKIKGNQIDDGELYYCPEVEVYYILQNEMSGGRPKSISPKDKGYKYSWYYYCPSKNWICSDTTEFQFKEVYNWISPPVTEFKLKEEDSICVVSDNRYRVPNTETPTISFKHYEIDFDEVRTIQDIKDILKALNITIIGSYAEQIKHLLKEKK